MSPSVKEAEMHLWPNLGQNNLGFGTPGPVLITAEYLLT